MLTPTQNRALEIIHTSEYCDRNFSEVYDIERGRNISKATLRKLSQLGYLSVVSVNNVSYDVRSRFGRGNHYTKTAIEVVYKLVK